MRAFPFKRRFIAGAILCGVLIFLLGRFTGFQARWRGLRDGMTQAEVMQTVGAPTRMDYGAIGAGNKRVTVWEYRRLGVGRQVYYCVHFDYIGPAGAPAVFKTDRYSEEWEWEWPSWWPWHRPKARA